MEDYKEKQKANLVEVNGKKIPRTRVGFKPTEKKVVLPGGPDGEGIEKNVAVTSKRAYIIDETTGAHLRIGGKQNGKLAKKLRRKLRQEAEEAASKL